MRYNELSHKEIVNITKGARLGTLGQTDLEIDVKSGKIESFIITDHKWFGIKRENEPIKIPWRLIKKIGEDMIMIEE